MAKAFYLRLAWSNIRRGRKMYLPHMIATAIISAVVLLIAGIMFSNGLSNAPSGQTAQMMFSFGLVVFIIFTLLFMVYINNFLIGRRKKEFGLYGILGLDKRHIGRVLVWENLITLSIGVAGGIVLALVFGQLLFLMLLNLTHVAPGSSFAIAFPAYVIMLSVFAGVFVITSLLNLMKVKVSSPMQLFQSEKKGEKDSKLLIPAAILGAVLLIGAYFFAWVTDIPGMALGIFFPLAILVIIATYLLFSSGSIAALRALRANKRIYYKQKNFIAIGGMFQRMRQNAKSLATICILSTMLVVTVSCTLALYLGQDNMMRSMYPYDFHVNVWNAEDGTAQLSEVQIAEGLQLLRNKAAANGVTLTADPDKLINRADIAIEVFDGTAWRNNVYGDGETVELHDDIITVLSADGSDVSYLFDTPDGFDAGLAFANDLRATASDMFDAYSIGDYYTAKVDGYGAYGGLLFMGIFFGLLFLAVTVLIIYFKQITEGYEDREQYVILQKVGMDDRQVRSSVNRQVLWVFFIPLIMTAIHMVFASKIMSRMLVSFQLDDWGLVLLCIGGTLVVFALIYLVVYLLTAKLYYRIVKR